MNDTQEPAESLLQRLMNTSYETAHHPFASPSEYHEAFLSSLESTDLSLDQAVLGGALADRVAYAFTAGYQSALTSLVPTLRSTEQSTGEFASFCITEEGGNSPKAIEATLTQGDEGTWLLKGTKTFVTGCNVASRLLIAASIGLDEQGRKKLRMVHIEKERSGVSIELMPELPFVPEVAHGIVTCDDVIVAPEELLPGDGYVRYIKPFRTIEDLHVSGAILGYVTSRALATTWPKEIVEELLALVLLHRQLAMMAPDAKALHIAMAGARRQLEGLLDRSEEIWRTQDPEHFRTWQRDKQLLRIARSARTKRTEIAWREFLG